MKLVNEIYCWEQIVLEKNKLESDIRGNTAQLDQLMRSFRLQQNEAECDDQDEFLDTRETDHDYFLHHL